MADKRMSWDVVVIGGGAAGIAAAEETAKAGCRTLLLEARRRLGGRVYTLHEPHFPAPLELGAEFIHELPTNLLEIAERGKLPYHDISDAHAFGLSRPDAPELVPLPHFWEDLQSVMQRAAGSSDQDRPFSEFLESVERDHEFKRFLPLVKSYVEGFHAADTRLISLKSLAKAEGELAGRDGRRLSRFTTGYGHVIEWLSEGARRAGAEIRLNTVVHRVRWSRDGVELRVSSRAGMELSTLRARKLIVTIPLSLLHASVHENVMEGAIQFEPALKEKRNAVDHLRTGPVTKILLRFRTRFWEKADARARFFHQDPEKLAFIHHVPDPNVKIPTWWTQLPMRVPLLTGWAGGPQAFELGDHNEEGMVDEALSSLAYITGFSKEEIAGELEGWNHHDWQNDPYSRGAYSYVGVGGERSQRELAEPLMDTLFFAGEATHAEGLSGTVDGALETGVRAAHEAIAALRVSAEGDQRQSA